MYAPTDLTICAQAFTLWFVNTSLVPGYVGGRAHVPLRMLDSLHLSMIFASCWIYLIRHYGDSEIYDYIPWYVHSALSPFAQMPMYTLPPQDYCCASSGCCLYLNPNFAAYQAYRSYHCEFHTPYASLRDQPFLQAIVTLISHWYAHLYHHISSPLLTLSSFFAHRIYMRK